MFSVHSIMFPPCCEEIAAISCKKPENVTDAELIKLRVRTIPNAKRHWGENPNVKDLKIEYGFDDYSRIPSLLIAHDFPSRLILLWLHDTLRVRRDVANAMRWINRGLTPYMAARKIILENDIGCMCRRLQNGQQLERLA